MGNSLSIVAERIPNTDMARVVEQYSQTILVDNIKFRYVYEDNKYERINGAFRHADDIMRDLGCLENALYEMTGAIDSHEQIELYAKVTAIFLKQHKNRKMRAVFEKALESIKEGK